MTKIDIALLYKYEEIMSFKNETEQILKEYAGGTRKAKPFANAHELIQEILAGEDKDDV